MARSPPAMTGCTRRPGAQTSPGGAVDGPTGPSRGLSRTGAEGSRPISQSHFSGDGRRLSASCADRAKASTADSIVGKKWRGIDRPRELVAFDLRPHGILHLGEHQGNPLAVELLVQLLEHVGCRRVDVCDGLCGHHDPAGRWVLAASARTCSRNARALAKNSGASNRKTLRPSIVLGARVGCGRRGNRERRRPARAACCRATTTGGRR